MEEDLDNSGNAILPGLMTPVQRAEETAVLWEDRQPSARMCTWPDTDSGSGEYR